MSLTAKNTIKTLESLIDRLQQVSGTERVTLCMTIGPSKNVASGLLRFNVDIKIGNNPASCLVMRSVDNLGLSVANPDNLQTSRLHLDEVAENFCSI